MSHDPEQVMLDRITTLEAQLEQKTLEVEVAREGLTTVRRDPDNIDIGEAVDTVITMIPDGETFWSAQANCRDGVTVAVTAQVMGDGMLTPAKQIEDLGAQLEVKDAEIVSFKRGREINDEWIIEHADELTQSLNNTQALELAQLRARVGELEAEDTHAWLQRFWFMASALWLKGGIRLEIQHYENGEGTTLIYDLYDRTGEHRIECSGDESVIRAIDTARRYPKEPSDG